MLELAAIVPAEIELVVLASKNASELYSHISDQFRWSEISFKSQQCWRMFELPRYVQRLGASLVHVPIEAPVGKLSVPLILTVHENPAKRSALISSRTIGIKEWASRAFIKYLTPFAARRAARVLAVSQTVAAEVRAAWRLPSTKVVTTYEAASERFFNACVNPDVVPDAADGYVLTFATGDPREDIEFVMAAYAAVRPRQTLAVAGRYPDPGALRALAARYDILGQFRYLGYVPEEVLPSLYATAAVFVQMTCYEGFGLQVVEAMAAGAPVVVSDLPVLREIATDAALYVQLQDVEQLAMSLRSLLADSSLRANLSARALTRARAFSWRRCAEQTLAVYREVLDQQDAWTAYSHAGK